MGRIETEIENYISLGLLMKFLVDVGNKFKEICDKFS